jgi:hypothetical protein
VVDDLACHARRDGGRHVVGRLQELLPERQHRGGVPTIGPTIRRG